MDPESDELSEEDQNQRMTHNVKNADSLLFDSDVDDTNPIKTENVENLEQFAHCESNSEYVEEQQSGTDHENGNNRNFDDEVDSESDTEDNETNIQSQSTCLSQKGVSGTTLDQRKHDMSLMSEAQRKAFKNKAAKPDGYYYRFNEPGEAQSNGKWSTAEHKLFMERVKEKGVNTKWGIFSKSIPGRVGYQCSNYWRELIKMKWVEDDNYLLENGGSGAQNKRKMKPKLKQRKKKEIMAEAVNPGKDYFDRFRKYQFTVVRVEYCSFYVFLCD